MKDLDFKLRKRFEQKEYFGDSHGETRLEKIHNKKYMRSKEILFEEFKQEYELPIIRDQPIIHGAMEYRCEKCGRSWFMYLEIGVEDHGKNGRPHQPCPFCITCHYCGGIAQDMTGYIRLPFGVVLENGMRYFAYDNSGKYNACGKATIYK